MHLSLEDVKHFFRLHHALMFFTNQRLKVLDEEVATLKDYARLPSERRARVQQALLDHRELIDAFADEDPFHLDVADLEIVRSWKHLVTGTFYVFRQLKDFMVFLSMTEPVVAYGVVALIEPFAAVIGPDLPRMLKTTLLPFKGRIVYDGLATLYNISFGPGIRRRLNETYREAKERTGIVTMLPSPAESPPPIATRSSARKRSTKKPGAAGEQPKALAAARSAHDRIVALTDAFCRDSLDDEYAALCRKLAGLLARKRPSPLARGKAESWASGIVRTVGWVNFLGDPSQPHHMRMIDIDKGIGVSEATGSARSMEIRRLLKLRRLDPEWTLPSRMEQNPIAWLIEVDGLIADARRLPREIQEQAFRKGLIPYIPADRAEESAEE